MRKVLIEGRADPHSLAIIVEHYEEAGRLPRTKSALLAMIIDDYASYVSANQPLMSDDRAKHILDKIAKKPLVESTNLSRLDRIMAKMLMNDMVNYPELYADAETKNKRKAEAQQMRKYLMEHDLNVGDKTIEDFRIND